MGRRSWVRVRASDGFGSEGWAVKSGHVKNYDIPLYAARDLISAQVTDRTCPYVMFSELQNNRVYVLSQVPRSVTPWQSENVRFGSSVN